MPQLYYSLYGLFRQENLNVAVQSLATGLIWDIMRKAQEPMNKALALPAKERADLAGSLSESLDQTVDENAEAAWQEEILRRLEEVQSGKAQRTSWDNVRQKGRALLNG